MKLAVYERIIVLNILPSEGDFVTLKLVRNLKENLGFSDEELEALNFHNEYKCSECNAVIIKGSMELVGACPGCGKAMESTGKLFWNQDADKETEIDISKKANELIANKLQELSDQKKLTDAHYSLYEKFIGDDE